MMNHNKTTAKTTKSANDHSKSASHNKAHDDIEVEVEEYEFEQKPSHSCGCGCSHK